MIDRSGEQVRVNGYIAFETTIGLGASAKDIEVKYLVVDVTPYYKVILGRLALNLLGVILSTRHLNLKYPLSYRHVDTVKGDRAVDQECYINGLEVAREPLTIVVISRPKGDNSNKTSWEPRLKRKSERIDPN